MAFYTIHTPDDLTPAARRSAYRQGPRMVNTRSDYRSMLKAAGFRDIRAVDVTREYARISAAWRRGLQRHAPELRAALGDARVLEMLKDNGLNVEGIRHGLLCRSLFVATR